MLGDAERTRLMVAVNDPVYARALIGAETGCQWVGTALNCQDALELVKKTLPDVLVTDLTLRGQDGAGLIHAVRGAGLARFPGVIALTVPGMELSQKIAEAEGAYAFVTKADAPRLLPETTGRLTLEKRLGPVGVSEQSVREMLWGLGFSARNKGTAYLGLAANLAVRDVRVRNRLTTQLYPTVAARFDTTVQRVEHGIRRAVEAAWSGGCAEMQYRLFGNTIDARRAKPTAGEMIACLAERLRAGLEM